jgi:hypothetical protein
MVGRDPPRCPCCLDASLRGDGLVIFAGQTIDAAKKGRPAAEERSARRHPSQSDAEDRGPAKEAGDDSRLRWLAS